jgi:hypothetical protein
MYLHETQSRSRVGAHIFLSEDNPTPHFFNGTILTTAKTIIKFVMASADETYLAALFIATCKMVPQR